MDILEAVVEVAVMALMELLDLVDLAVVDRVVATKTTLVQLLMGKSTLEVEVVELETTFLLVVEKVELEC
jgi:hypothetical protein